MASRKSKENSPLTVGDHARKIVKLKEKYDNWGSSTKNSKYIDLCFNLGKSYNELNDRKKALDALQGMVNAAKEIDFKLSFEQMILYSELLIKPKPNWKAINQPTLDRYQKEKPPSKKYLKTLDWICNSFAEMKSRNFRPKQITECEVHLAIAFYKCQNYVKAYDYFMFSFDYKSRNLSENIFWSFICCGIDNMKMLNKREDLLKFYKVRSLYGSENPSKPTPEQFGNTYNCSEIYVSDMITLFEFDWELFKHESLEASPYFNEVVKAIERLKNFGIFYDYFYVDFSLSLLKLGILTDWIPKFLISYNNSAKYDIFTDKIKFRYQYCMMKYHFMRGENPLAIKHGMKAENIYEKDADTQGEYNDPDNNLGTWNLMTVLGQANLELGKIKEDCLWYFIDASKKCNNEEVRLKIFDKLSRVYFYYGFSSSGIKVCEEALTIINQSIEVNNYTSVNFLKFDPSLRIAQFWRREGDFEKTKKALEDVRFVDEDYLRLVWGTICIGFSQFGKKKYGKEAADKSMEKGLEEFRKVVRNIHNFKDLRSFLNRNRQLFVLFPDDRNFFVSMFLHLSTDIKKPLSLDMIEKVNALKNSKKINCYLKEKFQKNNLIAPLKTEAAEVGLGEIGGPRFSFHKGQEP